MFDSRHASGRPEIFNTDQGSQFTSDDFTGTLKRHGVTISAPKFYWGDRLELTRLPATGRTGAAALVAPFL